MSTDSEQRKLSRSSYFAENDGHDKEVQQQRLRQMAIVKREEEDSEEDHHILVGRTTVGGTKKLQACYCDHQSADPGGHFKRKQTLLANIENMTVFAIIFTFLLCIESLWAGEFSGAAAQLIKDDKWIENILFHKQQPHMKLFKPHHMSRI